MFLQIPMEIQQKGLNKETMLNPRLRQKSHPNWLIICINQFHVQVYLGFIQALGLVPNGFSAQCVNIFFTWVIYILYRCLINNCIFIHMYFNSKSCHHHFLPMTIFLQSLIDIQQKSSIKDMALNPRHKPNSPPIWEMKSTQPMF